MEQKYGNVYVQEHQVLENGKELVVAKLLEGVKFCNTHHKWHDMNGDVSPLNEYFKGSQISVQWTINQKDKCGKEVEFKAKITLPIKLGELPLQDFEGCPKVDQEKFELWENLGILSGDAGTDNRYNLLRDIRLTATAAAVNAGFKIADMKLMYTFLDPYFILDDFIELSTSQKDMPFKSAFSFWSAVSDILEGKLVANNEEELQKIVGKLPPQYQVMFLGSFALRKEIVKKGQNLEHLFQTFREFHESIALENSAEWNKKQATSTNFQILQRELRFISVGVNMVLEIMLVDQNIRIDNHLRESFLFKSLFKYCCQHLCLVNDLMSLKKEMAGDAGATCNTVYLLHDKEGLSLEDSFGKTIEEINLLNQLVDETGELFTSLYGEYPEAKKFVQIVKCAMYGNIHWGTITKRYDPDMIFDCVVEK